MTVDIKTKKYEKVIQYIVKQISIGDLNTHQKLPSENELMDYFDVSSITVKRAMKELSEQGYIYRVKGRGSFVSEEAPLFGGSGGSKVIALIMSDQHANNSSLIGIIKGIQRILSAQGHFLLIEYADGSRQHEKEALNKMIGRGVNGLLLYLNHVDLVQECIFAGGRKWLPYVMLDRWDPDYPCNLVSPNNPDAGHLATEYLLRAGHRKIAFIGYHFVLASEKQRYDGYCAALRHHGQEPEREYLLESSEMLSTASLARLQSLGVTACFCVNDKTALHCLDFLEKCGISVPEQMSIMGFDDFEPVKYAGVPLTTMRQDFEMLGAEGAQILLDNIRDGEHAGFKKIFLPTCIVERQSVRFIV